MISLLTAGDIPEFTAASGFYTPAGIHIKTELALYGPHTPHTLFWLGRLESGKPFCALCRMDDRLYASVDAAHCKNPELLAFIRAVGGFSVMEAPPDLCRALGDIGCVSSGALMQLLNQPPPPAREIIVQSPPVMEVYALVCAVEGWQNRDPRWSPWYVHLTRLVSERRGRLRGVYADGQLVCTGGVYASDRQSELLCGICTLPEYRGRGYAGAIVRDLCAQAIRAGKTPVLACDPPLRAFYGRLGFGVSGEWASLTVTIDS